MSAKWNIFSIAMAGLALCPSASWSHGCSHGKDDGTCCKNLGCWIWSVQEVEECVYDVTVKKVKKTIKVPYIRQIDETVSCKVCKPFATSSLRECPVTDYFRSAETIQVEKCVPKPACGGCGEEGCGSCSTCGVETVTEPHVKTCLTRTEVTRQVPVLEWQLIAVEDKIKRVYYVRDWKDEEVELDVLEKTPRTIKRQIWTRVPAPSCGCETCPTCSAEPVSETPTEASPVKPDSIQPDSSTPPPPEAIPAPPAAEPAPLAPAPSGT